MGHQREERRGADGLFEETIPTVHNGAFKKMESLVEKKSSWELKSSGSRISFLSTLGYRLRLCVCNGDSSLNLLFLTLDFF